MSYTQKHLISERNLFPLIGCHISITPKLETAPVRAAVLGCEVFQIFSRSPRGGKAKKISSEQIKKFRKAQKDYNIKEFYIHSPYYINLSSSNNRMSYYSEQVIKEELKTATLWGASYVVTHLGSVKDLSRKKGLQQVITLLKKTLEKYQGSAKLLLENTAGSGKIIGDKFSELNYIIQEVNNPAIAGICLDTQHSFASGYNWKKFESTLKEIKKEINFRKIKLIHANDSRVECGSRVDRHAHIGEGKIGLKTFQKIIAWAKQLKVNMILETKSDKLTRDIQVLKNLREKA